jgi:hypothetical protein
MWKDSVLDEPREPHDRGDFFYILFFSMPIPNAKQHVTQQFESFVSWRVIAKEFA